MKKIVRFVGLDVHAEMITIAVAEAGEGGEVRSLGNIPNRPECVHKLIRKTLREPRGAKTLKVCYEAGPCGYDLYWQLVELGVHCDVIAPTLIPVKPGDRVKTNRRDALKLARCYRAGELTPVWVPGPEQEALRDLVRAREAAKKDQTRARHRLQKFLLRKGLRPEKGVGSWSVRYLQWIKGLRMPAAAEEVVRLDYLNEVEHCAGRVERLEQSIEEACAGASDQLREVIKALQAMRGIKLISAVTLAVEAGEFSRFKQAKQLMGYAGNVSSESSSGTGAPQRGPITKTGNSHLRRIITECAWAYRHKPGLSKALRARQKGVAPELCEKAWKAQHRLHKKYWRMLSSGKCQQQAVTAVGREMLGFVWDIGRTVENELRSKALRAAGQGNKAIA